jgi:hypothetical protein
MAQPQLVATGNPASPYVFAKRGLNGYALVLLALGVLGIAIGVVLFFVGQSIGSNPQSLGDLGTSVQLSIVGGVVGGFGLLSLLLWLTVEGIRH